MPYASASKRILIRPATTQDREEIYRLRHEVYARELHQHETKQSGVLEDDLDDFNVYLVAIADGGLAGFISITPPGFDLYSVDKYLHRQDFPRLQHQDLYEVRLLTVTSRFRGREIAGLLMYGGLRWIESHGGEHIVALGRHEVLDLYLHVGLEKLGHKICAGAVSYELLTATTRQITERIRNFVPLLNRLERASEWQFDFPFRKPAACFHGGAFFDVIGPEFDHLERRNDIINADVLDAWFPPAPGVMAALQQDLPWLLRTSPPTACEGLTRTIARIRGVPVDSLLPAAGSSDAIFLALRHWLSARSRALILDPTYGEYPHILEQVIHCQTDRLPLKRENLYQLDPADLLKFARRGYNLIALVNPNSPTGRHLPRTELASVLQRIPSQTLVWLDETYVDYTGTDESLEQIAAHSSNIIVCKSMSKVYALSGVRAAYLCGPPRLIEELRAINPPWAVSLPAQVAAVSALQDPDYYAAQYRTTHHLRSELMRSLAGFDGWTVVPGAANFLLCHLPADGPETATLIHGCREQGLFLRDAGPMGRHLGKHALRIAVKDAATNRRMLKILAEAYYRANGSFEPTRARV